MSRNNFMSVLLCCVFCRACISCMAQTVTRSIRYHDPYNRNRVVELNFTSSGIDCNKAQQMAQARGGYLCPIPNYNNFVWIQQTFGNNLSATLAWVGIYTSRPTTEYSTWYNFDGSSNDFINTKIPWNNRSATAGKEDRANFWYDNRLNDLSQNSTLPTGFLMIY